MSLALLAYIDPGSGSLLVQMVIAGVIGAGLCFRNSLVSFVDLFRFRRGKKTRSTPTK